MVHQVLKLAYVLESFVFALAAGADARGLAEIN
jgi:hypothetical protein